MKKLAIWTYYAIVVVAAVAQICTWFNLGPEHIGTRLISFLKFSMPLYSVVLATLPLALIAFFLGKGYFRSKLIIHTACYGKGLQTFDVTEKLRNEIKNNTLDIVVGNHIAGDPCQGVKKQLVVTYGFGNQVKQLITKEKDKLHLPE